MLVILLASNWWTCNSDFTAFPPHFVRHYYFNRLTLYQCCYSCGSYVMDTFIDITWCCWRLLTFSILIHSFFFTKSSNSFTKAKCLKYFRDFSLKCSFRKRFRKPSSTKLLVLGVHSIFPIRTNQPEAQIRFILLISRYPTLGGKKSETISSSFFLNFQPRI